MLRRAEVAQSRVRFDRKRLHERGGEPGFADPGLAGKQHHMAFACLGSRPASQQQFKLFFSSDEGSQAAGVHRRSDRPSDPLQLPWSKVPQLEKIAQQPSRGLGNDDGVRLGDALKARREVRRLADDTALLRFAGPDKVSDHHHPRGSPNPQL